jgi:DNA gyrase subunit B
MPELIINSHLFIAQPPLYSIKSGKTKHWVYSDTEKEELLEQIKGSSKKIEVQRYKGLGEMSAEQLWETTMNPTTRTLLSVNVDDTAKADTIFSMLMGGEVLPRKTFIQAHAKSVKNLDI